MLGGKFVTTVYFSRLEAFAGLSTAFLGKAITHSSQNKTTRLTFSTDQFVLKEREVFTSQGLHKPAVCKSLVITLSTAHDLHLGASFILHLFENWQSYTVKYKLIIFSGRFQCPINAILGAVKCHVEEIWNAYVFCFPLHLRYFTDSSKPEDHP